MQPEPKVNILLVDDRAENLLALEAILESLGQNLVRADSGQEALRQLLDRDFAVILLDVQMPGMDGFETATLIRNRPRNQGIPIIFITAFSKSDGLVFKGYDAGAVDYLFKPVVPEILRSKVAVFIDLFNKAAEIKSQAEQLAVANQILQTAHDQLEVRVRERTAELAKSNQELRLEIIERHRTEAALRESEERFRLMANCAPVMIWIADVNASCTFFNQGWLTFTGHTLEQEIGEGWTKGVHPEDVQRCLNTYYAAFAARLEFEMEYRLKRADGIYGWIFNRATPLFLPDGSFTGYIGSCLEITDRKASEAALRSNEERFRIAAESISDLIYEWDMDTGGLEWYGNIDALLDYAPGEFPRTLEAWEDRIHPEDHDAVFVQIQDCLKSRKAFSGEYRIVCKSGEYRIWLDRGRATFDAEGNPSKWYGAIADITERKRAEEKLRESEQRLSLAIEGAGMATWDADIQTGKSLWSAQHFKLLGYEPSPTGEATLEMWRQRVHSDDLEQVMQAIERARQERSLYSPEHRNIRADNGQIIWLATFGRFLYNQSGEAVRFVGISFDITDRKQAEEALYQAKLELEHRVTERTRELSESNAALKNEILERQQTEIALRESEARYRAVVEDQTELICRFLPDGTITFVNLAYCRYFGLTQQELIGSHYEPVVFVEDRQKVLRLVRSMSRENPMVLIENRVVANGEVRWTQWINRSLFNEQGDFVEFQAVGRDVTAHKQAEIALAESKHSLQKIADTAPVILYVYDLLEERNVYINREITELLGYTPEDLQTMEPLLRSILHADDLALTLERNQHWQTAKEGEIIQTEYRLQHKDGEWRYFQSQETLFARTPDGSPRQILCAAVDITAAKQLAEVRRAEEQLQASLHEKEVLLKEIHHRVKNNLQIVDSLLRLHSRQVKDEQVAGILLESQNRIQSIALVHEKLYQSNDLSGIQFADYIPNLVVHLFSSYKIDSSAVALKIQVDDISLGIDTAIPCGLIINELVSNALKYAFPADRAGEIRVKFHTDQQRRITLTVNDNGIGMPENFDPLETKSLGLKLVWGLVEQLEGTIALDRRQGTRFTITFPGDPA